MTDLSWDALTEIVAEAVGHRKGCGAFDPKCSCGAAAAAERVLATLSQHIPLREIVEGRSVVVEQKWLDETKASLDRIEANLARPR